MATVEIEAKLNETAVRLDKARQDLLRKQDCEQTYIRYLELRCQYLVALIDKLNAERRSRRAPLVAEMGV